MPKSILRKRNSDEQSLIVAMEDNGTGDSSTPTPLQQNANTVQHLQQHSQQNSCLGNVCFVIAVVCGTVVMSMGIALCFAISIEIGILMALISVTLALGTVLVYCDDVYWGGTGNQQPQQGDVGNNNQQETPSESSTSTLTNGNSDVDNNNQQETSSESSTSTLTKESENSP